MIKNNLNIIFKFLSNKKYSYLKILDIENISSLASYFFIISFDNIKSVESISDELMYILEKNNIKINHIDGIKTGWIVFDLIDIIIHIFNENDREFYNLEKTWADAKVINI